MYLRANLNLLEKNYKQGVVEQQKKYYKKVIQKNDKTTSLRFKY